MIAELNDYCQRIHHEQGNCCVHSQELCLLLGKCLCSLLEISHYSTMNNCPTVLSNSEFECLFILLFFVCLFFKKIMLISLVWFSVISFTRQVQTEITILPWFWTDN